MEEGSRRLILCQVDTDGIVICKPGYGLPLRFADEAEATSVANHNRDLLEGWGTITIVPDRSLH